MSKHAKSSSRFQGMPANEDSYAYQLSRLSLRLSRALLQHGNDVDSIAAALDSALLPFLQPGADGTILSAMNLLHRSGQYPAMRLLENRTDILCTTATLCDADTGGQRPVQVILLPIFWPAPLSGSEAFLDDSMAFWERLASSLRSVFQDRGYIHPGWPFALLPLLLRSEDLPARWSAQYLWRRTWFGHQGRCWDQTLWDHPELLARSTLLSPSSLRYLALAVSWGDSENIPIPAYDSRIPDYGLTKNLIAIAEWPFPAAQSSISDFFPGARCGAPCLFSVAAYQGVRLRNIENLSRAIAKARSIAPSSSLRYRADRVRRKQQKSYDWSISLFSIPCDNEDTREQIDPITVRWSTLEEPSRERDLFSGQLRSIGLDRDSTIGGRSSAPASIAGH